MGKKKSAERQPRNGAEDQFVESIPLDRLKLDPNNPRLGHLAGTISSQVKLLDTVVDIFGVDDVLSSLAVNGFFNAEPLVGVNTSSGDIRIVEGNRRLAACLILAGDDRAENQESRIRDYKALQKQYNQPPITEVPVLIHEDDETLLPYLGVRHIAAAQPWDSYAKAAWVAHVLDVGEMSLVDVSKMIGDQHRTVARMLEGYYFVNQLIDAGSFNPKQSHRSGRGSNPDYPFSWVYTALGFKPIRRWLCLADLSEGTKVKPLKKEKVSTGGDLMVFLLGNKQKRRAPAINDSRQIPDLAQAIAIPEQRRHLKRGKSLDEVARLTKPAKERVSDGLFDAQESLREILPPLSEGEISAEDASELIKPSSRVRRLASQVRAKITEIASESEDDLDE